MITAMGVAYLWLCYINDHIPSDGFVISWSGAWCGELWACWKVKDSKLKTKVALAKVVAESDEEGDSGEEGALG